ncbi:hypothetical protein HYX12_00355 [Candidatus Woesearchaeota archaeon]|nr:hypothetical protein [Candidatus Woesearchaeota archaeon]
MIKPMLRLLSALKSVYSFKISLVLTVIGTAFFFIFPLVINNIGILFSEFSLSLYGAISVMNVYSLVLLSLTSVLAGIVMTMIFFLLQRQISGSIGLSLPGMFLSIIAPACPSCALGLLGILGLGGLLTILPFKGLELGFLGILLLSISLVHLVNKINATVCIPDAFVKGSDDQVSRGNMFRRKGI